MRFDQNILIKHLFDSLPGSYLILQPDPQFIILDANNAYLQATGTTREIIGQPHYTLFSGPYAGIMEPAKSNLTASLEKVLQTKQRNLIPVQKQDTRVNVSGKLNTRYWHTHNIPVLDNQENIVCIIHSVEDVTDKVILKQHLKLSEHKTEQQILDAISSTQELERMEISRELHDNINQILLTSRMYLDRALYNGDINREFIQSGLQLVNNAISEIKNISRDYMKSTTEETNLSAVMNNLLDQIHSLGTINISKSIQFDETGITDSKFKGALFRIAQECIANVLKHSEASHLFVSLTSNKDSVTLFIQDDGKGFNPVQLKPGLGFQNMKSRVAIMDGILQIDSKPGKGCAIKVSVPVQR